ncbi:MAG: hypothetical protein JXA69_08445, partial [Phycisphaerae bacterium]|nr:hypothetical protein [Phycisphaerae bacterium]
MPTFFRRRYMRDTVPMTERVVGFVVVALTAGIVTALVLTVQPSESKLFEPSPEYLQQAPSSREVRVARQMMPALPAPWGVTRAAEAYRAISLEQWVGPDAEQFRTYEAAWAYRGEFGSSDDDARVTVTVFDMSRPPCALGILAVRRPADATAASLGRGGWVSGGRAAFWSGRYYTEIEATGPDAAATAAQVAQAAAATQLTYGGPFPAEGLLPDQGCLAGTFRYVRKAALGAEMLDDAFLADYEGDRTGFVVELAGAAAAEALLGRFREKLGGGTVPVSLGTRGAAGTMADRTWLVAANGRYVIGMAGPAADAVAEAVITMDTRLGATTAQAAAVATPAKPSGPAHFPTPSGAGWVPPTEVRTYTEDNLYERINGKAGIFFGYLFRELKFGVYQKADRGWSFDVYVYDMDEPDNAFGIYRTERSVDATVQPLGREGYTSGASTFFWKDRYYVNVLGPQDEPDVAAAAEALARAIEQSITDAGEPFWAAAAFPEAGQVAGSLSYKATNALGYSFLDKVFVADYAVDEKPFQLFVRRTADADAAAALFEQYAVAVAKYNTVIRREAIPGGELLASDSLGVY